MYIGPRTIQKTIKMLNQQLFDYKKEMEEAYCKSDNALDVALKVKYTPCGSGVKIETSINFVADRVKDSMRATCDEQQLELFEETEPKVVPIRPSKVSGSTSGEKCRMRSYR